jgi:dTMP kinase
VKGFFITFEGPDGAGKTTQIKMLAESLKQAGHKVLMTREPGGTHISDQIRTIILAPEHKEMTDHAEVLLYAASRAQHIHELIIPALNEGKIVLCDRYIDASMAYQAYGLGMDEQKVRSINEFASSGLNPIRTYMVDISPEESRKRLTERAANNGAAPEAQLDRIEQKQLDYHRKVREGFLHIASEEPERVKLINGARSITEVFEEIARDCEGLIKQA